MTRLWKLPATWEWCTVGELGDVVSGGTPSTKVPEYWGGDIIWIAPSDLTGYGQKYIARGAKTLTDQGLAGSSAKLIAAGSVMFSSRAPIGYVAINSGPSATNQGFKSIVPHSGFFNEYIYYYLKAAKHIAEERASGTTFKELSGSAFSALPVPIAPSNEQRRIVAQIEALFDEIDRGVESLQAAKRTIDLYRRSLLESAFRGRLTAPWRAENADKLDSPDVLLRRIREEREVRHRAALDDWERALAEWSESGENGKRPAKPKRPVPPEKRESENLRELPAGWFYLSFDAVVRSIRNGISVKPDEIGSLKIFRISAVRPMAFDLSDFRHITDRDGSLEDYRLRFGDLVFTRYNGSRDYVGVSAMYRGDGTHVYPDKLIRCRIDSDLIDAAYLEAATNSGESRSHLERRIRTTAGQSGVSGADIKSTPVPICPPAEQAEIVRILDGRLEAIDTLQAEVDANLARADALRQSILKKAFVGKLVPQDHDDEPAQALLASMHASREGASTAKRRKRAGKRASGNPPS